MTNWLLLACGVGCTALAQIFIKQVSTTTSEFSEISAYLSNRYLWLAIILYACSFVLYIRVLKAFDLSMAAPLMTGVVILIVSFYGWMIGETVSTTRLAGALLMILGIALIVRSA